MALRYPEDIKESNDFIKFAFYEYRDPVEGRGTTYSNEDSELKGTKTGEEIYLIMPNDIGSNFTGAWGGRETTSLAQFALGTIKGPMSGAVTGGFTEGLKGTLSTLTKSETYKSLGKAMGDDGIKFLADTFSKLPGLGANLSVNDVLQLTTGTILNPNTELLYGGTSLRQHGYSFKMIPQSKTEAGEVIKIVQQFQKACLPKAKGAIFGTTGRNFISVPPLCEVTFHGAGGGENKNLPKYKLSGITSVNVSFVTDGNYMSFRDGEPIGLQLTIGLTETKLIFSDEIGDKYR